MFVQVIFKCCYFYIFIIIFQTSSEKGVSAFPEGENLFKWIATITGPEDTVSITR